MTFVLFGITYIIAFTTLIEILINKMLSNVEVEKNSTDHTIESSLCTLEMMNSTSMANGMVLHAVKDKMSVLKADLGQLLTRLEKLEKGFRELKTCPFCRKGISRDFRLCPYCRELLYATYLLTKAHCPRLGADSLNNLLPFVPVIS